tara:strand:+ start:1053 stop:1868 length:816 start_codon:yes stop_codon:yes gene_type:complete
MKSSAVEIINSLKPNFKPTISIILGSGLGGFTDKIKNRDEIPYKDLAGFPKTTVLGHSGKLVFGSIGQSQVLVFQGRAHYYEKGDSNSMRIPIETVKALGCSRMIITNSSGAINPEYKPGEVILIRDHINYSGISPLLGKNGPSMFIDMTKVYDLKQRRIFLAVAKEKSFELREGVYIWFPGPNFETPAEINMAKLLGADVVGMSTVPEVILGRYYGIKISVLSLITNMAAGVSDGLLSHELTIKMAKKGAHKINDLLSGFSYSYQSLSSS